MKKDRGKGEEGSNDSREAAGRNEVREEVEGKDRDGENEGEERRENREAMRSILELLAKK